VFQDPQRFHPILLNVHPTFTERSFHSSQRPLNFLSLDCWTEVSPDLPQGSLISTVDNQRGSRIILSSLFLVSSRSRCVLLLVPRFARWPEVRNSFLLPHLSLFILSHRFSLSLSLSLSLSFSLSRILISRSRLFLFHLFLPLLYQAEDGSGHERATTLLLDSDVVAGAEVRRISIGFEPDTGGRPKTP